MESNPKYNIIKKTHPDFGIELYCHNMEDEKGVGNKYERFCNVLQYYCGDLDENNYCHMKESAEKALQIIKKYNGHPAREIDRKVLPVLSNQKMNAYLKEIGDICGLSKTLTTHLARHTFATTITLTQGISMESVSKMLGHSDIKTTQIYAKVTNQKILGEMLKLRELTTQWPDENDSNDDSQPIQKII